MHTTKAQQDQMKEKSDAIKDSYQKQYEALAKKYPNNPIYLFALSRLYYEDDPMRQEELCKQALKVDKDFMPAYDCLSAVASLAGDYPLAADYYRHVVDAHPDDPDVASKYNYFLRDDPEKYKKAVYEMVARFPTSSEAASALYGYAFSQQDTLAQQGVLEEMITRFPPAKFSTSKDAAEELFFDYDQTDPAKAMALAHEMIKQFPKDKTWPDYAAYTDAMADAEQKLSSGQAAQAAALLSTVKLDSLGRLFDKTRFLVLQSRALAAEDKVGEAYSTMFTFVASQPTDKAQAALFEYGTKLGKTEAQVQDELWKARSSAAMPEHPFTLTNLETGQKVSLSDYRGRVVILDFFFPNCGPCRGSYPYLQKLHNQFSSQGVALLAVNGVEGQASFVVPMFKKLNLDFTPLEGGEKFCSDVYHVRGFPTTLLIGADGRIYFATEVKLKDGSVYMKPHPWLPQQARTVALEIEALLRAPDHKN
jgi:thiol-disulfide isomerase/thioredoxin